MESQVIHQLSVKVVHRNSDIAEIRVSYTPSKKPSPRIDSSSTAHKYLRMLFLEETIALQEQSVFLQPNKANLVIEAYYAFTGGITVTVADIRIIMGVALKAMAVAW